MSYDKLVSIIIPTYNRVHLLGETLESVLTQTYQNWECIVVDDWSTDGTEVLIKEYIEKDSRFQYHKRPESYLPGGNGARNYGYEISSGEYIQWFDSDDIMLPGFLESRIMAFDNAIELVICNGYKVNPRLENRELIPLNLTENLYKDYALKKTKVLTPSVLFRKSFLLDKSLFLEKIERGQETELFLRLFYELNSKQYKIIDEPLFLYRQHINTKSSKGKRYISGFIEGQTDTNIENLKRSLKLEDKDLVLYFYKLLIKYFFRGIENDHRSNSRKILKSLITSMGKLSFYLKLELFVFGNFLLIFNKSSHYIEMRLTHNKKVMEYSF